MNNRLKNLSYEEKEQLNEYIAEQLGFESYYRRERYENISGSVSVKHIRSWKWPYEWDSYTGGTPKQHIPDFLAMIDTYVDVMEKVGQTNVPTIEPKDRSE